VNAHLHAHPSAQRYGPATHIQIVVSQGEYAFLIS
jgi:hypothetical protein